MVSIERPYMEASARPSTVPELKAAQSAPALGLYSGENRSMCVSSQLSA